MEERERVDLVECCERILGLRRKIRQRARRRKGRSERHCRLIAEAVRECVCVCVGG